MTVCFLLWLSMKFWTEDHSLDQILFDIPIIITKTLTAFFLVRWLIQKFIIEKKQYFLFFVYSTLGLAATGFIDLLRDYFGRGYGWTDLPDISYIIIHSYYYSAADLAVPFVILLGKKYFENQTQLAQLNEKRKDAELKLLRAQLSPHFLFNNLNTVDALIENDPTKAKAYIAKLSSLYRYLISTRDKELISLDQELDMVHDYFYLIDSRYGDAYTLEVEDSQGTIPLDLKKNYLPTGALQTVIENVVKHNGAVEQQSIVTKLEIQKNQLTVINNKGTQKKHQENFGTGLHNLKERYRISVDRELEVHETNDTFQVILPLITLSEA